MTVYNYEDLIQDIPGDSANVMFTIPPEMIEESGWKEGDTIEIEIIDGALHLRKKDGTD